MATHELPHMSEPELEAFLADHSNELGLTPQDAECFRIRRRRRSLEMATNEHHPAMVDSSNNNSASNSPSRAYDQYNISRNVSVVPYNNNNRSMSSGTSYFNNQNNNAAPLGSGPFRFVKATLLGDDTDGKFELASMFYTFGDAPVANPRPDLARRPVSSTVVDVQSRTLSVATPVRDAAGQTVNSTAIWRCELWMPENDNVNRELRTESMNGSHAIVVTFSTKDRKSFDAAASIWLPEAIRYARNIGSKGNGCEVPIILVGTNAEVRSSNNNNDNNNDDNNNSPNKRPNTNSNSNIVTATEAIQLAQDSGAAKYVEVYTGNSFHVRELFVQVVQAAVGSRVIAGVPDHFLWKRHRMHCRVYDEYFRAPKPEGYFHSWTGQFILTNGGNGDNSNNDGNGGGVEAFGTLDGSDPATSDTAFSIRGPLELIRGRLQTMMKEYNARRLNGGGDSGSSSSAIAPPALRVMMKKRGYFNSHTSTFPLPKTTPNPHGYVDVSSKMLHLFVRASASFLGVANSSSSSGLGATGSSADGDQNDFLALSQMTPWDHSSNNNPDSPNNNTYEEELQKFLQVVEIRYTLDGSDPDENSSVFISPIGLDVGSSNHNRQVHFQMNSRNGGNNNNNNNNQSSSSSLSDPMTPWSTKGSHPPHEVRAVAIAAGCFRSETVRVDVPSVLPAPRCVFNPTDGIFKIEAGTTTPGVEFRYTTDGSTPCGHSQLYTRPISLRRTGEGAVQQVRVAAFPKLALPSVAVAVNLTSSTSHHSNNNTGDHRSSSAASSYNDLPRVQAPSSTDAPVQMNRAAMLLAAKSRQGRSATAGSSSSNPQLAPGSRDATPTPRDRLTARRTNSANNNNRNNNNNRTVSPFNKNQQQQQQQAPADSNNSNNNVVPFDFPNPIKLFYLTATTPGENKGPKYFRILVKTVEDGSNNNSFRPVAEGLLEDYAGIQTLPLPADSRSLRITNVRCEFGDQPARSGEAPPSDSKFQLLDLKIHGNPW